MAIDQRIQTTITAGRRSAHDLDQGPIMVILLGCLAVAMCFTTLGMGFVNIASSATAAAKAAAKLPDVKLSSFTKKIDDSVAELKRNEAIVRKQIAALEQQKQNLADEEQAEKATVDSTLQGLSVERTKLERNKEELAAVEAQKKQLTARASAVQADIQAKLAGSAEEERRQLQLRAQLEQQLDDTRRQIAQAVRRIQELRESIEDRKYSLAVELLRQRDGKPTAWVECTRSEIVLLPQGSHVALKDLGAAPAGFLQAIAGKNVEFLIRPEGFRAFHLARQVAEQHGASNIGYEPVDSNWRLKY